MFTTYRNAFGQLRPGLIFAEPPADGGENKKEEWKAPESQEALNRIIADRVSRAERAATDKIRAEFSDYDELKKQADARKAEEDSKKPVEQKNDERLTAAEKRAQDAENATAALRNELLTERVQAQLEKALTGRTLNGSALFSFDAKSFIKDGAIDGTALKTWAEQHSKEEAAPPKNRLRGQGERDSTETGSVQTGRDLWASRHPKKTI